MIFFKPLNNPPEKREKKWEKRNILRGFSLFSSEKKREKERERLRALVYRVSTKSSRYTH